MSSICLHVSVPRHLLFIFHTCIFIYIYTPHICIYLFIFVDFAYRQHAHRTSQLHGMLLLCISRSVSDARPLRYSFMHNTHPHARRFHVYTHTHNFANFSLGKKCTRGKSVAKIISEEEKTSQMNGWSQHTYTHSTYKTPQNKHMNSECTHNTTRHFHRIYSVTQYAIGCERWPNCMPHTTGQCVSVCVCVCEHAKELGARNTSRNFGGVASGDKTLNKK